MELAELAAAFQRELRRFVEQSTYRLWLSAVVPVGVDGERLAVAAPPRNAAWLEQRFGGLLDHCARQASGGALKGARLVTEAVGGREPSGLALPRPERYRFANFAVGHANRLAHNAALTVAELPSGSFNPLFLSGPPGCGKSHLLGAIANAIADHHPGLHLLLTTGERFAATFRWALQHRGLDRFKEAAREVDVLLIDGLEFVCGKERTEEELFHTVSAVAERGGQVVLAARGNPGELAFALPQLRQYCESGLLAELSTPDRELRLVVLRRRAALQGLSVPDDALAVIADQASRSLRELIAAFVRVIAYSSLQGEPVSAALALRALRSFSGGGTNRELEPADVKRVVAHHLGVSVEQLEGKARSGKVATARRLALFLSRELTHASLPAIGRAFGGRDHTTVLGAVRSCEAELRRNPQLRLLAGEIAAALGAEPQLPHGTPQPAVEGSKARGVGLRQRSQQGDSCQQQGGIAFRKPLKEGR